MGRRKTVPVVGIGQFWDAQTADYGVAGSYALAVEDIDRLTPERLDFFDEFNRGVVDTDIWTEALDGIGSWRVRSTDAGPTRWQLVTGNVIDNDSSIHGETVDNKYFSPIEEGYTTVTWEARIQFLSVVDISALWGLFTGAIADYAEPLVDCAHFFADPAITNTFRARSFEVGEEETDTLVALDTDFHTFRIVWTAASVLFYIDDVLVATHAVQVPSNQLLNEFLIRTEAAAIKYVVLDHLHVEVT